MYIFPELMTSTAIFEEYNIRLEVESTLNYVLTLKSAKVFLHRGVSLLNGIAH